MGQIYSRASNVCVWLGEEDKTSPLAFQHIDLVLDLQNFENTVSEEYAEAWAALAHLMKRDWFSRRWVVQEIAFALKATVHCGNRQIDWTQLADAVALFGSRADEIASLFRAYKKYNHRTDYLGDVEALGANRLVTTISMLFRRADNGNRIEKLLTLESLVSRLSAFKASVPHDIIYAVLSLASDTITSATPPVLGPWLPDIEHDHRHAIIGVEPPAAIPNGSQNLTPSSSRRHRQNSTPSASGREPVFTFSRRPSNLGQARPTIQHPDAMASTNSDPSGHPLGHRFATAVPEAEHDAKTYLIGLGFPEDAVNSAIERMKIFKPWVMDGMSDDQIAEQAKVDGSLRDAKPIPDNFWDQETRNTFARKNGPWAVAFKLLWQQHGEPKVTQNLQARGVVAEGKAKAFLENLHSRVSAKTFHVDYKNKKFYEVCKEFLKFIIRSSESLDMLFRPWAPVKEDLPKNAADLPSWICRLDKSPFRPRPDGNFGRVNADLLVGFPDSGSPTYSASALTKPLDAEFDNRSLFVDGMVLDEIDDLRVPAVEGSIPNEWLELSGWHEPKKEPPESFWRTIVGDRDHQGHNPPWYYRRACQYVFAQRVSGGALNIDRLMMSESSKIVIDYLKRVQAVVFNRRLIKTKVGQRLGLVPDTAKEGDKVCILRGCSVPVILREIDNDGAPVLNGVVPRVAAPFSSSHFRAMNGADREPVSQFQENLKIPKLKVDKQMKCRVVGECYIHGVMDGEAFRIRDRNKLPSAKFELV